MPVPTHTPQSIEAAGRFHAFSRGWAHGAGARAQDPAFTANKIAYMREEYAAGFEAGIHARRSMHAELQRRTGHEPTVLREAGGQTS